MAPYRLSFQYYYYCYYESSGGNGGTCDGSSSI